MNLKLTFVFLLGFALIISSIVVDSYSRNPIFSFNDPNTYKTDTVKQSGRTYIHSVAEQPSIDIYYTVSTLKAIDIDEKAGVIPTKLTIKKGNYAKLFIANNYEASCVFTIEGYGIRVILNPNTAHELEFNADKSGHYAFGCKPLCNCISDLRLGILEVAD